MTFSVLFCEAIQRYHMIVLGIYRLLDVLLRNDPTHQPNQMMGGHKRIVICYPPYNYYMDPSDMVSSLRSLLFLAHGYLQYEIFVGLCHAAITPIQ